MNQAGLPHYLFFLAMLAFAAVWPFMVGEYLVSVGLNLAMWIALSESWVVLSGMTGYLSLGHAVFYGVGAYVMALTWGVIPVWAGVLAEGPRPGCSPPSLAFHVCGCAVRTSSC